MNECQRAKGLGGGLCPEGMRWDATGSCRARNLFFKVKTNEKFSEIKKYPILKMYMAFKYDSL